MMTAASISLILLIVDIRVRVVLALHHDKFSDPTTAAVTGCVELRSDAAMRYVELRELLKEQ
jgi:hypothetical protein